MWGKKKPADVDKDAKSMEGAIEAGEVVALEHVCNAVKGMADLLQSICEELSKRAIKLDTRAIGQIKADIEVAMRSVTISAQATSKKYPEAHLTSRKRYGG